MHLESALSDYGCVFENAGFVQIVIPCDDAGAERIRFVAGAFDIIHSVGSRLERIVAHKFACQAPREQGSGEQNGHQRP